MELSRINHCLSCWCIFYRLTSVKHWHCTGAKPDHISTNLDRNVFLKPGEMYSLSQEKCIPQARRNVFHKPEEIYSTSQAKCILQARRNVFQKPGEMYSTEKCIPQIRRNHNLPVSELATLWCCTSFLLWCSFLLWSGDWTPTGRRATAVMPHSLNLVRLTQI